MIQKMATFLCIICICSCSSHQPQNIEPNTDSAFRNVNLLKQADENSPDYIVYASKAIEDLKQATIANMKSHNSGAALKYASAGVSFFPFRDDLIELKRKAIEVYVASIENHAKSGTVSCKEIQRRVQFLNEVAPDFIYKANFENCKIEEQEKIVTDFNKIILVNEPPELEMLDIKEDEDISDQIEKTLKNQAEIEKQREYNSNVFPFYEVLSKSTELLSRFYLDVKNFKLVEGSVVGPDDYEIYSKDSFYLDANEDVFENYCHQLEKIVNVTSGSRESYCEYSSEEYVSLSTSKLMAKLSPYFYNKYFLPRFIVLKMRNEFKDGKKEKISYLVDTQRVSNPQFVVFPRNSSMVGVPERYNKSFSEMVISESIPQECQLGMCIKGSKLNNAAKLISINIAVDLETTYILNSEFYLKWKELSDISKAETEIRKGWETFLKYSFQEYRKRFSI